MVQRYRPLDGVLLLDKPLEISSNAALQKARRLFSAEKAGHTGTLDPLASGLLPVCFGEATKYSTGLLDADKCYEAVLRLGQVTTTGDAEGEIIRSGTPEVAQAQIDAVLARFRGNIEQMPPMHSALKHAGKPLYEYIRNGETVERSLRQVCIHNLEQTAFDGLHLHLTVRCSKGTYVRTLAEDIGEALGCGAHLAGLRRTEVGSLSIARSHTLAELEAMSPEAREALLDPVESLLPAMPRLDLDATQVRRLAMGQRLGWPAEGMGQVALYGEQGFIGVGKLEGHRLSPERLLSRIAKQVAGAGNKENGLE